MADSFAVKDCALIAISTGKRAQNLREMVERIEIIPDGSIYHHFWERMLRSGFDDPEYINDFAAWAWRNLHDPPLAERLALINPTDFKNIDELRQALLDIIEERLAESEHVPWAKQGQAFNFTTSQIIIFDTGVRIKSLGELREYLPGMPLGSVYYHFIDARRRTASGKSDFSEWLAGFGELHQDLIRKINAIDPYFTTLGQLRQELTAILKSYHFEG